MHCVFGFGTSNSPFSFYIFQHKDIFMAVSEFLLIYNARDFKNPTDKTGRITVIMKLMALLQNIYWWFSVISDIPVYILQYRYITSRQILKLPGLLFLFFRTTTRGVDGASKRQLIRISLSGSLFISGSKISKERIGITFIWFNYE